MRQHWPEHHAHVERERGFFETFLHFEPAEMKPHTDLESIPNRLPCVDEGFQKLEIPEWDYWSEEPHEILVYTDGSYNGQATAWACLFVARIDARWLLIGYFTGKEQSQKAPQGALVGENLALQWATLWLLRYVRAMDWKGPVTFLWDSTVPGRRASGDYQIREDVQALHTRRLQQALSAYLGPANVSHQHVKAHAEIWPNEFVDAAAKAALADHDLNNSEKDLQQLNRLSKDTLAWLWLHVSQAKEQFPPYMLMGNYTGTNSHQLWDWTYGAW